MAVTYMDVRLDEPVPERAYKQSRKCLYIRLFAPKRALAKMLLRLQKSLLAKEAL